MHGVELKQPSSLMLSSENCKENKQIKDWYNEALSEFLKTIQRGPVRLQRGPVGFPKTKTLESYLIDRLKLKVTYL